MNNNDAAEDRTAYVRNLAEELYLRTVFSDTTTAAGTSYPCHARACFTAAECFVQVESEREEQ